MPLLIGGICGIVFTLYMWYLFFDWVGDKLKKLDAQSNEQGWKYKNPPRSNNGSNSGSK